MRAAEIIRGVLDLIDKIEQPEQQEIIVAQPETLSINAPSDDINHFKQIIDLIARGQEPNSFANEPNEVIADIDSVTTDAGGGINGPKDVDDLRGDSIRIFGSN